MLKILLYYVMFIYWTVGFGGGGGSVVQIQLRVRQTMHTEFKLPQI